MFINIHVSFVSLSVSGRGISEYLSPYITQCYWYTSISVEILFMSSIENSLEIVSYSLVHAAWG